MAIKLTGDPIKLSEDDRTRMHDLWLEVVKRLEELAAIMKRVTETDVAPPVRWVIERGRLRPAPGGVEAEWEGDHRIAQVCGIDSCGCYEDPPGICYVGCYSVF